MSKKYFNNTRRYFGYGKGAPAGTGILAEENGIAGAIQQTVIKFTNAPVTVANTTGASFGSQKIYDFPLGRILIIGGRMYPFTLTWTDTDIAAAGSGDISLGTTATADATLNSTDVDIMASTALLDPFVLGVGGVGAAGLGGTLVNNTFFDGTATAKDLYINLIIDDADVADEASDIVLLNGNINISWINLGI